MMIKAEEKDFVDEFILGKKEIRQAIKEFKISHDIDKEKIIHKAMNNELEYGLSMNESQKKYFRQQMLSFIKREPMGIDKKIGYILISASTVYFIAMFTIYIMEKITKF